MALSRKNKSFLQTLQIKYPNIYLRRSLSSPCALNHFVETGKIDFQFFLNASLHLTLKIDYGVKT